ncbi:MAG: glutamate--tRNA ligase, partial [Candidatus Methanomethylicia archaeon]
MFEFTKDIEQIILKHALLNAYKHGGKAQINAVLSKFLSELPQYRVHVKTILPYVEKIVAEVNNMPIEVQKDILSKNWPETLASTKPVVEEKRLPPLPNVDRVKLVKTRFAP